MAAAPKKRFRETLQDLWYQNRELIEQRLLDAINATKPHRVDCPNCKHRHDITIGDYNATIRALEVWMSAGFGKPGTDQQAPDTNLSLDEVFRASEGELSAIAHAAVRG